MRPATTGGHPLVPAFPFRFWFSNEVPMTGCAWRSSWRSGYERSTLLDDPAEIPRLVAAFKACTLPGAEWTHRAHLTVALWYVSHLPYPEALETIRTGIQRYNLSRGVLTTETSGYHETLTRFYTEIIARHVRERGREGLGRPGQRAVRAVRRPGAAARALQPRAALLPGGEVRMGGAGPRAPWTAPRSRRSRGKEGRPARCRRRSRSNR